MMNEPTKVTKVLISKVHGGRKQDSKFWQSEFSNEEISKPKPSQPHVVGFFLYPLIALALFISGYVSYYIYTNFVVSSSTSNQKPSVKYSKVKQNNYSPSTRKQKSYSKRSEDKPVTKRELDRAMNKALRQRSATTNKSVLRPYESPYYRVELTSGSVIRAKSAIKDGTHFTIIDIQGLEFSMQRSDIRNVRKIYPQ